MFGRRRKSLEDYKAKSWADSCATIRKSIVSVKSGDSIGTGWIAGAGKESYLLVTAEHVIIKTLATKCPIEISSEKNDKVELKVAEGSIRTSHVLDLPIINVPLSPPGPSLRILQKQSGKPNSLWMPEIPLGTEVGWMGFPESTMRLFGQPTPTFCVGHISAVAELDKRRRYCLDGNVNRGMSGAPIWDIYGNVLGMVLAYIAPPLMGSMTIPPEPQLPFPGFGMVLPIAYLMNDGFEGMPVGYIEE